MTGRNFQLSDQFPTKKKLWISSMFGNAAKFVVYSAGSVGGILCMEKLAILAIDNPTPSLALFGGILTLGGVVHSIEMIGHLRDRALYASMQAPKGYSPPQNLAESRSSQTYSERRALNSTVSALSAFGFALAFGQFWHAGTVRERAEERALLQLPSVQADSPYSFTEGTLMGKTRFRVTKDRNVSYDPSSGTVSPNGECSGRVVSEEQNGVLLLSKKPNWGKTLSCSPQSNLRM
jgi:hypothetical protein